MVGDGLVGKARGTTKSENRVGRRRRIGQSVKEDEMAGTSLTRRELKYSALRLYVGTKFRSKMSRMTRARWLPCNLAKQTEACVNSL